jgi:hypothetical protein
MWKHFFPKIAFLTKLFVAGAIYSLDCPEGTPSEEAKIGKLKMSENLGSSHLPKQWHNLSFLFHKIKTPNLSTVP